MSFVNMSKLTCWTLLLAYAYAGDAANDAGPRGNPSTYRPYNNGSGGIRRPGRWLSPEYKWFFEYPLPIPPAKEKTLTWTDEKSGANIDYYDIELKTFTQQIYPDLPATELQGYDGMSPGPTFIMQQGQEAVVRFTNHAPSNMSVHVHGQYNRAPFDGWAADYATPGQYKDYYYPNGQNARTIWYHDHTEYDTAENAYRGQEGYYILSDPQEKALGLPSGKYDIALALSSKVYGSDGQLVYDTNQNFGLWGDIIQVNGQPWPYLNVEPRKYRFRFLDASLSRSFTLSIQEGMDGDAMSFDVIGSDCGLLSHPVNTENLTLSEGERYEVIVDFANQSGKNFTMRNSDSPGENANFPATDMVMRFVVGDKVTDSSNNGDIPQSLREIPPIPTEEPSKNFAFERIDNRWVVNGVGFSDIENRILTRPERGADEIWVLTNAGGGLTHPIHIHLVDFQILSRTGPRNEVLPYEAAGRKDVVYLAPGETVRVVARYAPWAGVYMFHCHNLVHEDHEMLAAFNVSQLEKWGYTNDTVFIDPMQPEFRPKPANDADNTDEAIRSKIAWFWSTNAYNHGDIAGVESAIGAYATGGAPAESASTGSPVATQTETQIATATTTATPSGYWNGSVVTMQPKPWVTVVSTAETTVIDTMTIVGTYGVLVGTAAAEAQA